ncbi:MAG: 4Fe-4S cluster-binding domain-containing protein [Chthoniobacter sp.]|nr:4Fe-4S cluster-binding domain-containing protein [Chthoniobacter sp.]
MQLTFHVTKACNLRCRYCYYASFPAPKMGLETALRATDQTLALGHRHLGVTFFGGEPLLCKELIRQLVPAIKERCGGAGVSVNFKIPTNGLLLDAAFLQFCEEHAIFLSLSMDGDEEAQSDRVAPNGDASFQAAKKALHLLAVRATAFATYSVITPRNVSRLAQSLQALYQWGSRILITALDYSAPWTHQDLGLLQREYERLAEFYFTKTKAGHHFYMSAFDSKIAAHTRPDNDGDTVCRIGINQLSVAPDGTYFPCIQFVERSEFAVGHVSEGIDLQKCERLFSGSIAAEPSCGSCGIATRCSSHCACVSLASTGTLHGVPPIVCEHERVLTPIADAVAARLYRRRVPLFINKHYNPDYDLLRTVEAVVVNNQRERAYETVESESD